MDQGRRCRIRKLDALSRTVGRREGVGLFRNGIQGGRFDGIVRLGIHFYTTISYASFG